MNFQRVKIIKCEAQDNYKLWLLFDDGVSGVVDLQHFVGKGVFSTWNSIEFFKSVHINSKTETVTWDEDLDLDPYVLHDQILLNKNISTDE